MYLNIDELPLPNFVSVLCDGNYLSLYKGEPPAERDIPLEKRHFESLHIEYVRRMLDDDVSVYENLKRMALALSTVRIIEAAVMLAKDGGITDSECLRVLRANGVRLTGNPQKDVLVLTAMHGKAMRRYLEAKERYERQLENGDRQDRQHFVSTLAGMSSHFGFSIPFLTTTVGEFCALYRQMEREIREMKSRQAQQRKRNDMARGKQ